MHGFIGCTGYHRSDMGAAQSIVRFYESEHRFGTHAKCTYDTGSPQTYLCSETFGAFHITIHHPNNPISVNMNGSRLSVLESPEQSHFNEVNVLGTDYLRITNARIEINFNNDSMHIHVPGV